MVTIPKVQKLSKLSAKVTAAGQYPKDGRNAASSSLTTIQKAHQLKTFYNKNLAESNESCQEGSNDSNVNHHSAIVYMPMSLPGDPENCGILIKGAVIEQPTHNKKNISTNK